VEETIFEYATEDREFLLVEGEHHAKESIHLLSPERRVGSGPELVLSSLVATGLGRFSRNRSEFVCLVSRLISPDRPAPSYRAARRWPCAGGLHLAV
jgi:hypothetical protein